MAALRNLVITLIHRYGTTIAQTRHFFASAADHVPALLVAPPVLLR